MQFTSQTAPYISTYYFETKARDEDNYKSVVRIFAASIYFPCATFVVVSYLAFIYSNRISVLGTEYIKGDYKIVKESRNGKDNDKQNNKKETTDKDRNTQHGSKSENTQDNSEKEDTYRDMRNRRIMIFSISISSILLILTLFSFHVVASDRLIQYGNEVLYDDNDDYNSIGIPTPEGDGIITDNDHSYDVGKDDQCVPIVYVACSFFPTLILFAMLLLQYCLVSCIALDDVDRALGILLQASFGGFLVYLGFYFAPFMLLAFINDPIQATLIYLIGASAVFSIYLLTYYLIFPRTVWMLEGLSPDANYFVRLYTLFLADLYCTFKYRWIVFTLASGISIAYFLTIIILIVTLGNFHDFQALENLTLPIIIGLLSIFVFKPFYKYVKTSVEVNETDDEANKEADDASKVQKK